MGKIVCRNPKCEALRSTSVGTPDGIDIPECWSCGDRPYMEALDQPNPMMSFTQRELDLMRQAFEQGLETGYGPSGPGFDEWIKEAQFDSSP